jgi:hypothetical protein
MLLYAILLTLFAILLMLPLVFGYAESITYIVCVTIILTLLVSFFIAVGYANKEDE